MEGMPNRGVESRGTHLECAEDQRHRSQKALAFVKRHRVKIVLGVGCLVLTVTCAKQGRTIGHQRILLEKTDALLSEIDRRTCDLVELCAEKDKCHLKLASASLRAGCSEGGRALAEYRYWLTER